MVERREGIWRENAYFNPCVCVTIYYIHSIAHTIVRKVRK